MTDSTGSLGPAAERIRESAKWLVAAFAAVAAVLAAGLQLTSIGRLDNDPPHHRLFFAGIAILLVVVGVVVAIAAAAGIVTKSFITLHWLASDEAGSLRETIDKDKVILAGFASTDDLKIGYEDVLAERTNALRQYLAASNDARPALKKEIDAVQSYAALVSQTVGHVLERASFERLRAAYDKAKVRIVLGAVLTAIGVGVFAWAANPPATQLVPVTFAQPEEVVAHVHGDAQPRLQSTYPDLASCDLGALDAVVLAFEGGSYSLATVPTPECGSANLITIAANDVTITPKAAIGGARSSSS